MSKFTTKEVVIYHHKTDENDPLNNKRVLILEINPVPLLFGGKEHYKVFIPDVGYSYAYGDELRKIGTLSCG